MSHLWDDFGLSALVNASRTTLYYIAYLLNTSECSNELYDKPSIHILILQCKSTHMFPKVSGIAWDLMPPAAVISVFDQVLKMFNNWYENAPEKLCWSDVLIYCQSHEAWYEQSEDDWFQLVPAPAAIWLLNCILNWTHFIWVDVATNICPLCFAW